MWICAEYAEFAIGARNMQNFALLKTLEVRPAGPAERGMSSPWKSC